MRTRWIQSRGFTLVELLVAMAVLLVLMGGLAMLYVGSLRAVQQTMQQVDAFERARGALATMTTDLTTGFSARANAQLHNFYGTPIGMTFVTLVKNSDNPNDVNIARVTYVLYNMYRDVDAGLFPEGEEAPEYRGFENALETAVVPANTFLADGYTDGFTYLLIRYVEPNVGDLDAFPVEWDSIPFGVLPETTQTLGSVIEDEVDAAVLAGSLPSDAAPEADELRKMKRREFWIRMLAGGDPDVPNGWRLPYSLVRLGPDPGSEPVHVDRMRPYRYVVTENILSTVPPEGHFYPAQPSFQIQPWYEGAPIFDYDMAFALDGEPSMGTGKPPNQWWNDMRSTNCTPEGGSPVVCRDPRTPEIVSVSFWMMFESPYPGAPDFKRKFSTRIMVPSAYDRQDEVL